MADNDLLQVEIEAGTVEELKSVVSSAVTDFPCRPTVRRTVGGFVAGALATQSQLDAIRATRADVQVRVIDNATQSGLARREEVGAQNRFAAREVPRGLGIKE